MRKFIFFLFTGLCCLLSYQVFTNAGGPTSGVAGEPPLNETCAEAGCHTGSALNSGGGTTTIDVKDSLNNKVTSYIPNHTYTVTLSVAEGVKTRYGFEAIVMKGTGSIANSIGSIVVTDATRTQLFGGSKKYIMHKSGGIDFTGNTGSWSFNWKAPSNNNGVATIYAAFNASNKNNAVGGDKIYTQALDITGTGPFVGIESGNYLKPIAVYPNPAQSMITIALRESAWVTLYNSKGNTVLRFFVSESTNQHDISELAPGVYFANCSLEGRVQSFKIIKQ